MRFLFPSFKEGGRITSTSGITECSFEDTFSAVGPGGGGGGGVGGGGTDGGACY